MTNNKQWQTTTNANGKQRQATTKNKQWQTTTNNNKWQTKTNKILVFSLNLSNCWTLWVPPAYPQKTTNYKQQETTTNTTIYFSILLSSWRALFLLRVATSAPGRRMSNLPTRSLAWKNSLKKSFRSDQDDSNSNIWHSSTHWGSVLRLITFMCVYPCESALGVVKFGTHLDLI